MLNFPVFAGEEGSSKVSRDIYLCLHRRVILAPVAWVKLVNLICCNFEIWHHICYITRAAGELQPISAGLLTCNRNGHIQTGLFEEALKLPARHIRIYLELKAVDKVVDLIQHLERCCLLFLENFAQYIAPRDEQIGVFFDD